MTTTVEHTQLLTVVTCTCGIAYAIPESLHDQMNRHRESDPGETCSVYCPLGHRWHYIGKSAETKAREAQRAAEARMVAAEDQLAAEKRAHARTRTRISKGVCPCCKRSFANVGRHMASQHPDYNR